MNPPIVTDASIPSKQQAAKASEKAPRRKWRWGLSQDGPINAANWPTWAIVLLLGGSVGGGSSYIAFGEARAVRDAQVDARVQSVEKDIRDIKDDMRELKRAQEELPDRVARRIRSRLQQ